jgi:hypothetical protein
MLGDDMTEFRYYCLHDDGKIALGEYIEAADLNEAIDHAYAVARAHPTGAFHYVEVWRGPDRLYSSPRGGKRRRSSDAGGMRQHTHQSAPAPPS